MNYLEEETFLRTKRGYAERALCWKNCLEKQQGIYIFTRLRTNYFYFAYDTSFWRILISIFEKVTERSQKVTELDEKSNGASTKSVKPSRKSVRSGAEKCQTLSDCQATKSAKLLRRDATHGTGNFEYGGGQVSYQNIGSIYQQTGRCRFVTSYRSQDSWLQPPIHYCTPKLWAISDRKTIS